MVSSWAEFRQCLFQDAVASGIGRPLCGLFVNPVFRFIALLRVNEYLVNVGIPKLFRLLPLLWFRRLSIRLGYSIPLNVFGPGLCLVHYGLVVVSPHARIGANCRVHCGVNIGGAAGLTTVDAARELAPTIGDRVYIGPGAKIFGPVVIGDDCVIGANAVVNKSFSEAGKTIAGVPAKVVANKGSRGLIFPSR